MNCKLKALLVLLPLSFVSTAQALPQKTFDRKELEQFVLEVIRRNPKEVSGALEKYQREQARSQRQDKWKQSLEKPTQVDIRNAPSLGEKNAPLILVEFSDFECPYCRNAQQILQQLLLKYKGRVRLAYMHLPLPMHKQARNAAQAAWAAGQQGKFFEYHDRLFSYPSRYQPETYEQLAKELGLDIDKFNQDRQSPQAVAQIEADLRQARELGVQSTPTFVLNGIVLNGALPIAAFEEVIEFLSKEK